jgi:hypothetical protein
MASSWIVARTTKDGGKRYRVLYRLGGRESKARYVGSFKTKAEALERRRWVNGELAAMRVPDVSTLAKEPAPAPTLGEAAEQWRASRVDVEPQTASMHRSAFVRMFKVKPELRSRRLGELTVPDVAVLVAALADAGYKRETLRKSRTALAQTLDFFQVEPNVARDERVKLPRERKAHISPPLAEHVENVLELVASRYVLPLLVLDECGPRVSELEHVTVGDLDEERLAIRVRPDAEKNERYRYLHLPDDLFAALWRRSRHGRTATQRRRSSPASRTRTSAWPSHGRARRAGCRTSRRTH